MKSNTFKPGDRVTRTGPHRTSKGGAYEYTSECKVGDKGTVTLQTRPGDWQGDVPVKWDHGQASRIIPSSLTLEERAPVSPAEYAADLRSKAAALKKDAKALLKAAAVIEETLV